MNIHVVGPGQTLLQISRQYGVDAGLLAGWNGLSPPYRLAVGQAILVLQPEEVYTVRPGDTLFSVARAFSLPPLLLLRRNPRLGGSAALQPGQTLAIALQGQGRRPTELSGYAYPYVRRSVLRGILPYATYLVPFTYGIREGGGLVALEDAELLSLARQYGADALMHLSTLTETGNFSTQRAAGVLASEAEQQALADAVTAAMESRGYRGLDVDFEFVGGENAAAYAAFVGLLRGRVNALGYPLITALAPKVSPDQPGVLYEGHDYAAIAQNSDAVLLMTYEWGYRYQPPCYMSFCRLRHAKFQFCYFLILG